MMIRKMFDGSELIPKSSVRSMLAGLFVINTMITLIVAFNGASNDSDINRIAATQHLALGNIAANTAAIQKTLTIQCNDRNTAAVGTNGVLDGLLKAVKTTKSLPPAEKAGRVALYNSLKIKIIDCTVGQALTQYKAVQPANRSVALVESP